MNNKVLLNLTYFRDAVGFHHFYQAISVIEYRGIISSSGQTRGHYTCDVRDAQTNSWYRTNDNANPLQIPEADVSKQGYVILYKRI